MLVKFGYAPPEKKSHKRLPGREPAQSAVHFGVNVRSGPKHGLKIDRDSYAVISKRSTVHFPREYDPVFYHSLDGDYEDEDHRIHTDEWCAAQQLRALENFDLNMAFFESLDAEEFDRALTTAVAAQKGMVEVTDLNEWEGTPGLYVMVLDNHRQAYVGITESVGGIKGRIRQHWSSSKSFDTLLWGKVNESIMAVDSFRALDKTRIFAAEVRSPLDLEHKVIKSLPKKYILNRIMGGDVRAIGFAAAVGVDIVRKHDLSPSQDRTS